MNKWKWRIYKIIGKYLEADTIVMWKASCLEFGENNAFTGIWKGIEEVWCFSDETNLLVRSCMK